MNTLEIVGVECPNCGKHTLINDLKSETEKPLYSNLVGKCTNQECNYEMTPGQFNARYFQNFDTCEDPWSFASIRSISKDYTRGNIEDYNKKELLKTGLSKFLCEKYDEKEVLEALSKYYVRTCETEPDVILTKYWCLDINKNEFNSKLVSYDPVTGNCTSSDKNQRSNACLFGLHLIDSTCKKRVCLVENEKTAIIASIAFPNQVWLATGGQEINYALIKPLIGLDVALFPTNDQYYKWKGIAEVYKFKLSTLLKCHFNLPNTDLSDYILSKCDTWHQ